MSVTIEEIDGAAVLPGYILCKLGPPELGELERHFKIQHLSEAASAGRNPESARVLVATAMNNNARGIWRHGTQGFVLMALNPSNLPKMLQLSLRRKHPNTSEADARAMITPENEPIIHRAVLGLAGVPVPELHA